MAHYAKLGLDNIVTAVVVVDNIDCMTRGGIEKEEIGIEHLIKHHGHELWKKCSFNTHYGVRCDPETNGPTDQPGFRANYPGTGWYYNSQYDIFHPARPVDVNENVCNSYILNTTTGMWKAPLDPPEGTYFYPAQISYYSVESIDDPKIYYTWDEQLYQSDNTKGWVLKVREL